MSEYTPTVWKTGDVITAEKLNNIEEGIAGAPMPTGKITITENGEDIDVSEYALADVNVPAPVSDFSTAEVTVTNTGEAQTIANAINIVDDQLNPDYVSDDVNVPVTAVLYKGSAQWVIRTGTVAVTGNASTTTAPIGTVVNITGNCTITIS